MSLEGELVVRLEWDGHRVKDACIASTRPFAASRVLEGKTPAEAVAIVPRLFTICGSAQSAAAARAVEGAGAPVDTAGSPLDVLLEAAQEYFWRLLIDWPQTMGHPIDAAGVSDVRRQIASRNGEPASASTLRRSELGEALSAIAAQKIYGRPPADWLTLGDADALLAWADRGATTPARLLGLLLHDRSDLGCSNVALM